MNLPAPAVVHAAVGVTWPPASVRVVGPFVIRDGQGGGSRVSAATVTRQVTAGELPLAVAAMRALGQVPLFMVRDGEGALDVLLAAAGYALKDPVIGYVAPVARLTVDRPPSATTFEVWPPLAVQREIWAEADIGPERLAIMDRVLGPKTSLLGRLNDSPAGTAFVACDGSLGMLHGLEVRLQHRRQGLGRHLLRAAAHWAKAQGAAYLSLVVTEANTVARAAYESAGMVAVGRYHYRILSE